MAFPSALLDDQVFVQFGAQSGLFGAISATIGNVFIHDLYSFIPECRFKIGDLHLSGSLIVLFESSYGSPNLANYDK